MKIIKSIAHHCNNMKVFSIASVLNNEVEILSKACPKLEDIGNWIYLSKLWHTSTGHSLRKVTLVGNKTIYDATMVTLLENCRQIEEMDLQGGRAHRRFTLLHCGAGTLLPTTPPEHSELFIHRSRRDCSCKYLCTAGVSCTRLCGVPKTPAIPPEWVRKSDRFEPAVADVQLQPPHAPEPRVRRVLTQCSYYQRGIGSCSGTVQCSHPVAHQLY